MNPIKPKMVKNQWKIDDKSFCDKIKFISNWFCYFKINDNNRSIVQCHCIEFCEDCLFSISSKFFSVFKILIYPKYKKQMKQQQWLCQKNMHTIDLFWYFSNENHWLKKKVTNWNSLFKNLNDIFVRKIIVLFCER
jgi:hypothetical protein